ncbi:hypothetical protein R0K18_15165 [Pantoea sp. SIMBA_133]
MNKVQTGQVIAAAMAGGMIIVAAGIAHAEVVGNTSTDFTVGIDVHDADACSITVTPPAVKTFSFSWDKKKPGAPGNGHERMSMTKLDNAPIISVVASGGDKCSVNGVRLITRAGEGSTSTPGVNGNYAIMMKSFGSKNGHWVVRPLLSKITLYSAADKSTASDDAISVTSTVGTYLQSKKLEFTPGWWGGMSKALLTHEGIIPAPQWFAARAHPGLLAKGGSEGTLVWKTDKPEAVYKAADFGINVMVSSDPVDSTGQPSLDVATEGDKVSAPFTVTISQA